MNEQLNHQEYPKASREYKDRLFRFVFRKKEDLLDLYNAVNDTAIQVRRRCFRFPSISFFTMEQRRNQTAGC